jgi:hypothetical protein
MATTLDLTPRELEALAVWHAQQAVTDSLGQTVGFHLRRAAELMAIAYNESAAADT